MRFFDRKLELVVYTDTVSYTIRDLHMDFNILLRQPKKTKKKEQQEPKPNQAQITIFNLSEATRNLFSYAHRAIEFKIGYGVQPTVLIFSGVTVNVFSEKMRPGWMTTIYASDGHKEWSDSNFNKSYKKGIPILTILNEIGASMGMPIQTDYSRSDVLLLGTSYIGKCKDVLNKICGDYDLNWSIQNGTLRILDNTLPDLFLAKQKTVILSSDTGLLDSPIIQEESRNESNEKKGKKKSQEQEKRFFNVLARSVLNPELFPGVPVQFKTLNIVQDFNRSAELKASEIDLNGIFICEKVNHLGSNYTNEFITEIETREKVL